jgi:hypothetical protein
MYRSILSDLLKGHSHRFSKNYNSLQCTINVFLIIRQNAYVILPVKREIQSSNSLLFKQTLSHLYRQVYSMRLDTCTLLKLTFKATFFIYKFILNTNKRCLLFVTSSFVLNMIFSSMLSIFELCQRK